jgi:ribonuclease G
MARARNRDAVLKTLRKALDEDRTKTFVVEISPLGLVEMTRQNVTDGAREIMTKPCPTCNGDGVVKSEETIAIAAERRLRELVAEAGGGAPEAYLVRMNPKVTTYFTEDGARMLHALEEETGRFFNFTGSEGLPLDHFAIVEQGAREAIEEHSVPFREGEEVHVDIVEPHMYSEDDAVAKVDGYLIEVKDGVGYVGEKVLVRIEQASRTGARAVLAEVAEEAAAATEERRQARERAAKRADSSARTRRRREPAPVPATVAAARSDEDEAVRTLADDDVGVHAGTGPAAVAEADEDAAKPRGRRRGRGSATEADGDGEPAPTGGRRRSRTAVAEDGDEPAEPPARRRGRAAVAEEEPVAADDLDADASEAGEEGDGSTPAGDDDAVQSRPRRRGRRGGRRRSRAKADAGTEVPEASE